MSAIEKMLLAPIIMLVAVALIGAGATLYSYILESPIINILIVIFSFWLTASIMYKLTREQ